MCNGEKNKGKIFPEVELERALFEDEFVVSAILNTEV